MGLCRISGGMSSLNLCVPVRGSNDVMISDNSDALFDVESGG